MLLKEVMHTRLSILKSPPFRGALSSSGVMAFAGLGDAILYPLLPIYGESLGFTSIGIGILLSINRFVRIISNTWIANLINSLGMKKMIMIASILAVITTISYGLELGFISFLIARIIWGLSYSGLKISTLNYAAKVKKQSGLAFGMSQSIKSLGALAVLGFGPMLIASLGIQNGLIVLGAISVIGILMALSLPALKSSSAKVLTKETFYPSSLNILVLVLSISIDGILVVVIAKLLAPEFIDSVTLLSAVAFYLLLKRLFVTGISLLSGFLTLVVSYSRLFYIAVIFCIVGLLFVALGRTLPGLLLAFVFNAIVITVSPLIAMTEQENDLQAISNITTWWDMGSAIGALIGIGLINVLGGQLLFMVLSITTTLIFINFMIQYGKRNRTVL